MLNIQNVLELTEDERKTTKKAIKEEGHESWRRFKSLKHRLSEFTLQQQNGRCAYCETLLRKGDLHLEHFIPKAKCTAYTFEPQNIFTSCGACNSPAVKPDIGIAVMPYNDNVYELNIFKIVHPYLHNPDDHIKYKGKNRVMFDKKKCTSLGLATIRFFKWDNPSSVIDRQMNVYSRKISDAKVQQLIQKIVLYK